MTTCPKCNSQDAVQKVTSIVSGGTFQTTHNVPVKSQWGGHTFYGTVSETVTEKTELARKLSKPTEKDWKKVKTGEKSLIMQNYLKLHPEPGPEKNYTLRVFTSLIGIVSLPVSGLLLAGNNQLGLYVLLLFPISLFIRKLIFEISNSQEYKQWYKETQQLVTDLRRESETKYNMLYYCHRDDTVFLLGTDYCMSASDMGNMGAWIKLGRTNS